MYADANRLVLSRDLKAPIVSADLVDGDREFQTVGAAIENDLSANKLGSGYPILHTRLYFLVLKMWFWTVIRYNELVVIP